MIQVCSVEGCSDIPKALGYCSKHYQQIKTGGLRDTQYSPNTFEIEENICKIGLRDHSGKVIAHAIVDADMYAKVSKLKWFCNNGYAHCYNLDIRLHSFILNTTQRVDHKNRNSLDCRKENLRPSTISQNNANAKIRKDNKYGLKGVTKKRETGKWVARLRYKTVMVFDKTFSCPLLATIAYDEKAILYFKEFATPNILKYTGESDGF